MSARLFSPRQQRSVARQLAHTLPVAQSYYQQTLADEVNTTAELLSTLNEYVF